MRFHCHRQSCNRKVASAEWFCPMHRAVKYGDERRTIYVALSLPLNVARVVATIARRTGDAHDAVVVKLLKDSLGME